MGFTAKEVETKTDQSEGWIACVIHIRATQSIPQRVALGLRRYNQPQYLEKQGIERNEGANYPKTKHNTLLCAALSLTALARAFHLPDLLGPSN